MKAHPLLLAAMLLLASATAALADSAQFLAPRASAPIPPPQREPNRYPPYSRSTPHFQAPATPAPRQEGTAKSDDRPAPYSRSQPRFTRTKA